jgi:peptidoglycan/xylan/chitin deacetylase (PgdA/CDA1 family)
MIRNFLFHRVSPERDMLWDPMSVELFEKCIKYISEKYTIITIEDFLTCKLNDSKKNYETISALPILSKYNVKASFYVVTDCIENNIPTWTHILEYLFQNSSKTKILLDFDFLANDLRIKELHTLNEKISYVKKLKPFLKKISHEQRNLVLNTVTAAFNDVTLPVLMMNWDDLRYLLKQGHNVGSHTVSHCMLGTMTNESDIKNELQTSLNLLSEKLGTAPVTISYPVGSYNETTIRLSQDVGYKIGLAVKQDIYNPNQDSIFEIPRIELYNESWWKTKLRISHTLEKIKKIVKYR